MAKKKRTAKQLVVVECDGHKLKAHFRRLFGLTEAEWFAYYHDLKREGVVIGIQRPQGDKAPAK